MIFIFLMFNFHFVPLRIHAKLTEEKMPFTLDVFIFVVYWGKSLVPSIQNWFRHWGEGRPLSFCFFSETKIKIRWLNQRKLYIGMWNQNSVNTKMFLLISVSSFTEINEIHRLFNIFSIRTQICWNNAIYIVLFLW